MATFREFLSEGRIGDVRLGMTPDAVERHWGRADDRSVKRRPVEILKFGSVELAFKQAPDENDSRLFAFAMYFDFPDRRPPAAVSFDGWMPTADTRESEFLGFLESIGLRVNAKTDGDSRYLSLDSGASIMFVDDRLHSVHVQRADKAAGRRQMSVSLPESTVNQLRARARRENISLQELIERVLSATA